MRKGFLAAVLLASPPMLFLGACHFGEPAPDDLGIIKAIATCAVVLQCEDSCDDSTCATACDAEASPHSLPLVMALHECVANACPEVASDMGASDMGAACLYEPETGTFTDPTECNTCVRAAQAPGGACVIALTECAAATS